VTMRVFNTLTRNKEEFIPQTGRKVGIYACGPTVYDYFHIGNARIFIVFDVIRRYLRYRGYEVTFVQNFTDIDDKMINRANELGITVAELADRYIEAYFADAEALGVEQADVHPKATEHIPEMIEIIERLIDKGLAYEVDGDVYFQTPAFDVYGQLSNQPLDELVAGARVEVDERKKAPLDFALWKKQKPGEPAWGSPWGKGRPGWHIECSAMSMKYLGDTLDIHAGGPDLVFPHHENEKAQSEGATGKPFARYWLHAGYLNVNQEKMSKSLGNFMMVRDIRQKFDPQAIRFFMLSAHYRSPINFSPDLLEQAQSGLERLDNVVYNLRDLLSKLPPENGVDDVAIKRLATVAACRQRFIDAMDDDFNTALAVAALFDLAREVNTCRNVISQSGAPGIAGSTKELLAQVQDTFITLGGVLGLFEKKEAAGSDDSLAEQLMELIIQIRQEARQKKDWPTADAVRDRLGALGIVLEDTPQGIRWKKK